MNIKISIMLLVVFVSCAGGWGLLKWNHDEGLTPSYLEKNNDATKQVFNKKTAEDELSILSEVTAMDNQLSQVGITLVDRETVLQSELGALNEKHQEIQKLIDQSLQ